MEQIVVINSPVLKGTSLECVVTGFPANTSINVWVTGLGGFSGKTDGDGRADYAFINNDPAGDYTLNVSDNNGHAAMCPFSVTNVPRGGTPATPNTDTGNVPVGAGSNTKKWIIGAAILLGVVIFAFFVIRHK